MFKFNSGSRKRLSFSSDHSDKDTADFIAIFYFNKALQEGGPTRIPGLGAIIEIPKQSIKIIEE